MNSFEKLLNDKKTLFGIISTIINPTIIEVCFYAGVHFVILDGEHTMIQAEALESSVLAAHTKNIALFVRVPSYNSDLIGHCLDIGANGVMVPHIGSPDEAKKAVAAARYYPEGERGISQYRANEYALHKDSTEKYLKKANDDITVLIQIEDLEAVKLCKDIVKVSGINGVIIGTRDLATSMGHLGNTEHPKVQEKVEYIIDVCKEINMPVVLPGSKMIQNNTSNEMSKGNIVLLSILNLLYKTLIDNNPTCSKGGTI